MGFYRQPEEVQVDLLAYHQICARRDDPARFSLLRPMSLDDALTMELVRRGKVRPTPQVAPQDALRITRTRMIQRGQSPDAVDWLLTEER